MFDFLSIIIVFSSLLIFGGLLLFLIDKNKKNNRLNVDKFRTKWLEIENTFDIKNELSHNMCIIKADSLLDMALKEAGVIGDTMGERLKNSSHKLSKIDSVWTAHKIRNKLVHEHEAKINSRVTRQVLNTFKQALKDLGAI